MTASKIRTLDNEFEVIPSASRDDCSVKDCPYLSAYYWIYNVLRKSGLKRYRRGYCRDHATRKARSLGIDLPRSING